MHFFLCKKCFEAYDQTIIYFIYLTNENETSEDNFENDENLQETYYSDDDVTVDGDDFSQRIT